MQILTHARAELARVWSSRLGRVSLIALMTTPLWYGGLYLWGNQDPYSHLDRVPAALVVADRGATDDGDRVDYGRDAADEVLDSADFDWHEVTAAQAKAGVAGGTYDFSLTFPASFSADLVSAGTTTPTRASLVLATNDANSYLSTTIAKQAAATVRTELVQKVGAHASQTLLESIGDIRDGLVDASSGAQRLADGATDAASGASDLADGAEQVASGTQTSLTHTRQLASGLSTLSSGASDLADGTADAATGAARLSSGLDTLRSVTANLPASTTALDQGAQQLDATLADGSDLRTLIDAALTGNPLQSTVDGALDETSAGAAQLADGTAQLAASAPTLADGIAQSASGADALASGTHDAAVGAAQVASGAATASTQVHDGLPGAARLAEGASDVASGAARLKSGTADLESGATTLSDSLGSATDDIPDYSASQRSTIANAVADPADVDLKPVTEAANYGAGLAPFFISLAAWIGIYALFLILRPLSRRAITAGTSPVRTMIAGWLPPALLGAVQSIALYAVVVLALGLPMAHPWAALAFMIALSMTYAAIVLALNALLGSVGQFLGLILMIVQLVTAGGTFPWQTLPAPLAAVHQALPMAHAVEAIRQLMYGGSWAVFGQEIVPLALWLVGGLAVTVLAAWKQTRARSLREVRPAAIGG